MSTPVQRPDTAPLRAERLAAILILVTALAYFGRFVVTMSTTSLWNDELYTILHFSGRGPVTVLTDYHDANHGPNNHIFFNLLSSLLPGRASVNPLRARFIAFVAVALLLALGLRFLERRGGLLLGALFVQAVAVNWEFLDLSLQARGYALAALFALTACWGACLLFEGRERPGLVLLSGSLVLGTWSLPVFLPFGLALFLLAALLAPGRTRVLVALLAACAVLVLVHVPLLGSFIESATQYAERFGRTYAAASVPDTLRTYVLGTPFPGMRPSRAAAVGVAVAVVALAIAAGRRRPATARALAVLLGSSAAFLAACAVFRTAPLRTTSFVVVPIVLAALLALWVFVDGVPRGWGRAAPAAFLAVLLASSNLAGVFGFVFGPMEDWRGPADFLRSGRIGTIPVVVLLHRDFVEMYRPGVPLTDPPVRAEAFASGECAVLDNVPDPGPRFDGRALSPRAVEVRFPQRRNGWTALWFVPAHDAHPEKSGP